MASTIVTKNSSTASAVPLTGDLTQGELAVNVTDKRLFTKNSGGTVVELGINPSSLTMSGGTANGVAYLNGSKVVTTGSALTFDGTRIRAGGAVVSNNYYVQTDGGVQASASIVAQGAQQSYSGAGIFMSYESTYGRIEAYDYTGLAFKNIAIAPNGGNLGIGTNSPSLLFQVGTRGGMSSSGIFQWGQALTGNSRGQLTWDTDRAIIESPLTLSFNTSSTERMRLDSSGNLGLGVTPSAWRTIEKAFQIGTVGSLSQISGAVKLNGNAYWNSSNQAIYLTTDLASTYIQTSGVHQWYNAPSGTAGTAITFTQAMTLDASGNLGIGTTSPQSYANYKILHVAGPATNGSGLLYFTNSNNSLVGIANADGANSLITFGSQTNHAVTFKTNDTERARIDSSGNLLVGRTTSVRGGVDVYYASTDGVNSASGEAAGNGRSLYTGWHSATSSTSGTLSFNVTTNGNVTNTNNSYGAISDIKLKENIVDATPKLEKLCQVRVVNYNFKEGQTHKQIGVIAQELEQVFPSMVDEVPDRDAEGNDLGTTTKQVKYSVFVPMLIKAIQEQQALITQLQADVAALKGN